MKLSKGFKKIIWTHIFTCNEKYDLMEEIKKFQIDNPKIKIIDIKYSHVVTDHHRYDGGRTSSTYSYSAMVIYK